jgi:hypothetical protein
MQKIAAKTGAAGRSRFLNLIWIKAGSEFSPFDNA